MYNGSDTKIEVIFVRVVLTGGGTGGHVYPALAIGTYLQTQKEAELLYIGTKEGMEKTILENETDITFRTVWASGLSRKLNFSLVKALFKTAIGTAQALVHLIRFRPSIIIGTGGFVCAPTILAGYLLKIPCLLHEQNAYPGLTNRLLATRCKVVMTSFPEVSQYLSQKATVIETGLPIRDSMFGVSKKEALEGFGRKENKKTLLVTGGSRGAKSINNAVLGFLEKFLEDENRQIIFATGKNNYGEVLHAIDELNLDEEKRKRLVLRSYLHNMPEALAASDIVLSRAGATFLAEITNLGLPGVLVPYPYASENHQEYNARAVLAIGGVEMILDEVLSSEILQEKLLPFFENEAYYLEKKDNLKRLAHPNVLEKVREIVELYQKQSR